MAMAVESKLFSSRILLSRILITVGAGCCMYFGYKGNILFHKQKLILSDLLAELKSLLKRDGKDRESETDADPIAAQIRRLTMEVEKLSMQVKKASGCPVTFLNGGSGQNGLSSLVIPAAALGALGYGYMKWKGITFSDLMYVTKQNMTSAVANLTKHLEDVSEVVTATKRHLTNRIENLDGKVDEQVELSKLIKHDITDVRDDISQITYFLDDMEKTVYALGDKMDLLDDKQDVANAGVLYLCGLVHGKKMKLLERIQAEINVVGSSVPSIMGLKDVVQSLEPESNNSKRCITDGVDGIDISNNGSRPRALFRRASIKGCC